VFMKTLWKISYHSSKNLKENNKCENWPA
jgi:hypothetical protein